MSNKLRFTVYVLSFIVAIVIVILGTVKTFSHSYTIPTHSTIGGIDVSGKTIDEAKEILSKKIGEWKAQDDLSIETNTEKWTIPDESIQFDVMKTINQLQKRTEKPWYELFNKTQSVDIPLVVNINISDSELSKWPNEVDIEKTIRSIEVTASLLGDHSVQAVLLSNEQQNETIAKSSWEVANDYIFLYRLVNQLDGLTIEPGESFSFLEQVTNKVNHYFEDEGNFLASMLYSLFLQTNVNIVERHSQQEIPSYSEAGIEAWVSKVEDKDFVISNLGPNTYTIKAEMKDSTLNMEIYSTPSSTKYMYRIENQKDVDYRTIYRYDKNLKPGDKKVLQHGEKGKRIEVYRVSKSSNGEELSRKLISRDFYSPSPEIIAIGLSFSENDSALNNPTNDDLSELSCSNEEMASITSNLEDMNQNELSDENIIANEIEKGICQPLEHLK